MKAIVLREFGGPEVLKPEHIETPKPDPGEVLIQVHNVSVNVTLDILMRRGLHPYKPEFPHVLGVDPTGEVVALGHGVERPAVGERVAVHLHLRSPDCPSGQEAEDAGDGLIGIHRWGGYAEYITVPAENAFVIPEALSSAEACVVVRHLPTARHMLHKKARLVAGETILVMGATGGLGSCCIQVAKRLGATVIGAAGADDRVAKGIEFGADYGINYRTQDLAEEVMKVTDGKGVDYAFEVFGSADTTKAAYEMTGKSGTVTVVGIAPVGAEAGINAVDMVRNEKTMRGTYYGSTQAAVDMPKLVDMYLSKKLNLDDLVVRQYSLDQINEAYGDMDNGEVGRGVIIF